MRTFEAVRGMLGTMNRPGAAMQSAEETLVSRARRGDREAFDRIVQTYLPRVWSVVWRILRHREDTEDVVQEVFLSAYRAIDGFRGDSRLSTWLQRIAVTRALNHLDRSAEKVRRASRSMEAPADDPGDQQGRGSIPEEHSREPSPLQALEARELERRLAECLERLPPAWRTALALRDGEARPYGEIAVVLGIALGTVRSRLARARIALRQCIEGGTA